MLMSAHSMPISGLGQSRHGPPIKSEGILKMQNADCHAQQSTKHATCLCPVAEMEEQRSFSWYQSFRRRFHRKDSVTVVTVMSEDELLLSFSGAVEKDAKNEMQNQR